MEVGNVLVKKPSKLIVHTADKKPVTLEEFWKAVNEGPHGKAIPLAELQERIAKLEKKQSG